MIKKTAVGFIILIIGFLILQTCLQFRQSTSNMLEQFPVIEVKQLAINPENVYWQQNKTFPPMIH